mgnify:CR=1 FL=1
MMIDKINNAVNKIEALIRKTGQLYLPGFFCENDKVPGTLRFSLSPSLPHRWGGISLQEVTFDA